MRKIWVKEGREIQDKFDYANNLKKKPYFISNDSINKYSRRIRRMNKKLAWIEATPNDLDTWKLFRHANLLHGSFSLLPCLKSLLCKAPLGAPIVV
jgi:hypothetical protein